MDAAAQADAVWARALASAPGGDRPWLDSVVAAGARYGSGPVCVHRTPLFLSAVDLRAWQVRLARFHHVVRTVRAALLADLDREDDSLAAAIAIDPTARRWARFDPGYPSAAPLARLDGWLEDGVPRFLELNAESPAGMGYASVLGRHMLASPAAAAVAAAGIPLRSLDPVPRLRRTLAALWRERARPRGLPERPRVMAIVDFRGGGTWPELEWLAAALATPRVPCLLASPDELTFDGETLRAGDVPIDLVYRRALVSDLRGRPEASAALLEAYATGRVCVVNPLRTGLLHNKGVFALFRDPRVTLSPADRRFVERHVPASHVLPAHPSDPDAVRAARDAAIEDALAAPERWVLKPLEEHGGTGVLLGWATPGAQWSAALRTATHHLLQRRVGETRRLFHDARTGAVAARGVSVDPFLLHGRLGGFLCRLTEGELGNVTSGGATQAAVLVAGAPPARSQPGRVGRHRPG